MLIHHELNKFVNIRCLRFIDSCQVARRMEMLLSHSPLYTLEKLLLLLLPSLFSCSSQLLDRFLSLRKVVLNRLKLH